VQRNYRISGLFALPTITSSLICRALFFGFVWFDDSMTRR